MIDFVLVLNIERQADTTTDTVYLLGNQMPHRAKTVLICINFAVILRTVHGYVQITANEYHLMHYTRFVSEEYFPARRPLVIVLPLAEEASTAKEVPYLITELHASSR